MKIDFEAIKKEDCREIARRLGLELNRQDKTRCFLHGDTDPSLQVYEDHWYCHGCHEYGDAVDLVARYRGVSNGEAAQWIVDTMGTPQPTPPTPKKSSGSDYGKLEREHIYPGGQLKHVVYRKPNGKKDAPWKHLKNGKWVYGRPKELFPVPPLYYRRDELPASLFLTEGEKDTDRLEQNHLAAVSLPDGSGSDWYPEYQPYFSGRSVYIIQDNDDPGKKYAQQMAATLQGIAKSVYVLDLTQVWPEIPEHGDVSDLMDHMGDKDGKIEVLKLAKNAKEWTGPPREEATPQSAVDAGQDEPKRKRGRPRKTDGESKRDNRPSLYMATLEEFLQENHISVRYNQITHDVEITGVSDEYNPETLNDDLCVILHDQLKQDFKCNKNLVGDLLGVISGKHRYNPALDLLNSVQWDGVQRMEGVYKLLHIPVVDWLSRALIWKWFLQGVSLLENDPRHPFGADGILVLQGPQGCGKTSFCSAVGVRPDLVKLGQYIDNRDKDTTRRCVSAWIVELGEIETTLRSDLERLKAFLTAERDEYRLPYGRADQLHARRTSFIATCNSERFLIDPTGSRRFWTVPIEKIDLDELRRFDFLQVWAEAKVYAEAHPQGFRLTPEEQAALAQRNTRHEKPLKAQLEVEDIISKAESVPGYEWRWETVSAFKMEYEILRPYSVEQIGKALDKIGINAERKRVGGDSVKRVRELPFPVYQMRKVV